MDDLATRRPRGSIAVETQRPLFPPEPDHPGKHKLAVQVKQRLKARRIGVRRRWSARPFRKLDAGCDHDRPDNHSDRPTHPGHDTSVSDQPFITRPRRRILPTPARFCRRLSGCSPQSSLAIGEGATTSRRGKNVNHLPRSS